MRVNNDYVKTKVNEERAKAKKPRINSDEADKLVGKYEPLEYVNELTTIVQKLLKNLPELIQNAMEKKLNIAFGLAPAPTLSRPAIGSQWNVITKWPNLGKKPSQPIFGI